MAHRLVYPDGSSFLVSDRMILEYVDEVRMLAAKSTGHWKVKFQTFLDDLLTKPLIQRALPAEGSWPITSEMRRSVADSLVELVGGADNPLIKIAAARALISADSLNLKKGSPKDSCEEIPIVDMPELDLGKIFDELYGPFEDDGIDDLEDDDDLT